MSDDGPTINVTRGSNRNRRKRSGASSSDPSHSSSGLGLPGAGTLVSGMIRGVQNAWWAGLGVLAVAEDAGSKVFDALVEQGKSWEQERRKKTETTARRVQRLVGDGEDTVEAVEKRVRDEVNEVLGGIGVPRRGDLEELREQVDTLSREVERLARSIEDATETDSS